MFVDKLNPKEIFLHRINIFLYLICIEKIKFMPFCEEVGLRKLNFGAPALHYILSKGCTQGESAPLPSAEADSTAAG